MNETTYEITIKNCDGFFMNLNGSLPEPADLLNRLVRQPFKSITDKFSVYDAAIVAAAKYRTLLDSDRRIKTPLIVQQQGEFAVVMAYIAGYTIEEAVKYLKRKAGVSGSRSAVGRIFKALAKLEIYRSTQRIPL